MLKPGLQDIVEQLCNEGCQQVNVYILEMEAGQFPKGMHGLTPQERQKVLAELKSIMAVYERCEPGAK